MSKRRIGNFLLSSLLCISMLMSDLSGMSMNVFAADISNIQCSLSLYLVHAGQDDQLLGGSGGENNKDPKEGEKPEDPDEGGNGGGKPDDPNEGGNGEGKPDDPDGGGNNGGNNEGKPDEHNGEGKEAELNADSNSNAQIKLKVNYSLYSNTGGNMSVNIDARGEDENVVHISGGGSGENIQLTTGENSGSFEKTFNLECKNDGQTRVSFSVSFDGRNEDGYKFSTDLNLTVGNGGNGGGNGGQGGEQPEDRPGYYTITFKSGYENEGSFWQYVPENCSMILPGRPGGWNGPSGSVFTGWNHGEEGDVFKPAGNTVLTANWQLHDENVKATVTLTPGKGSGNIYTEDVCIGDEYYFKGMDVYGFTAPDGYEYYGFYVPDYNSPGNYTYSKHGFKVTGNITLSAIWVPSGQALYKVTYNPGGGTGTEGFIQYPAGNKITLDQVSQRGFGAPEGKEFSHWQLTGASVETLKDKGRLILENDVTATAVWKDKPHEELPEGFYIYREADRGVVSNYISARIYNGSETDGVLGIAKGTTNTYNIKVSPSSVGECSYILENAHGANEWTVYKPGTSTVIAMVSISKDVLTVKAENPGEAEFAIEALSSDGNFHRQGVYRLVVSDIGEQDVSETAVAASAVAVNSLASDTGVALTIDDFDLSVKTGVVSMADGSADAAANVSMNDLLIRSVMSNIAGMEDSLSESEKQALAQGDTYLYVGTEAVAEDDMADNTLAEIADKVPEGDAVAAYVDLNLYAQLGNNARRNISDTGTNDAVYITIDTADMIGAIPAGYERTFNVVRYHDGEAELLEDVTSDGTSVKLGSTRFSTYTITYSDLRTEQDDGDVAAVSYNYRKNNDAAATYKTVYFDDIKEALITAMVGWAFEGELLPADNFASYMPPVLKLLDNASLNEEIDVDNAWEYGTYLDLNGKTLTVGNSGVITGKRTDDYMASITIVSSAPGVFVNKGNIGVQLGIYTGDTLELLDGDISGYLGVDGGKINIFGGSISNGFMINNGGEADIDAVISGNACLKIDEGSFMITSPTEEIHGIHLSLNGGYYDNDPRILYKDFESGEYSDRYQPVSEKAAGYTYYKKTGGVYVQTEYADKTQDDLDDSNIYICYGDFVTVDESLIEAYEGQDDWAADGSVYAFRIKNEAADPLPVPEANTGLIYKGQSQALISIGETAGYTIKYAVVKKGSAAPAADKYSTSIPVAENAGEYTVYYKVNEAAPETLNVSIAAKPVTVSGITAANKIYDGTKNATLNTANAVFTGKLSKDTLTVTATGTFADADAGTGKTVNINNLTFGGAGKDNYILAASGQQTSTTANITQADHDDETSAASAKYGNEGSVDLTDLIVTGGTVQYVRKTGTAVSGTPSIAGAILSYVLTDSSSLAGGSASITVKVSSRNYKDYNIIVNITVLDKEVQAVTFTGVTDGAVSAVYGDASITKTAVTAGNGTISYSSNNTNVAIVDSTSGEVTIKSAGTATITATAAETDGYKAGTASYTLTVGKKTVTVSSISANSKVYDGKTAASLVTSAAEFDGLLDGDILTVTATGTFADANAGTDKEVTISGLTLGGASKNNYTIAETGNQTTASADITARAITIKADDQRVEIGKSIAEGVDNVSVTVGSLADGQRISSVKLTSTSTDDLTDSGEISVSEAVIVSGSTETTANYDISYAEGVMVVTNLKALITEEPVKSEGLVYTGVSQNLITSRGTAETSVEFSLNGTDYYDAIPTGTDAKTYTVYYRAKGDDSHEPGDAEQVTVAIAKAPLTVTASANTITYGDAPAGNGVTYAGFVNNETESVIKGTPAYDFTYQQYGNVGTYDITPKGLTADNYELTFVKGTLTVAKKAVTVSANAQTIAKDGKISTSLNQATAITPVSEDKLSAVTLTASINAAQTEGVIIPSAAKFSRGNADVTANYEISYVNGKLNIKPAAVVTAAPAAKTLSYNGTDQELVTAGTVSGGSIAYSLSENGTYSESIPTGKDARTYTVYYKPVPDADHSEGETGSVEVVIAKAAADVKADDKIKNAGKADPELTATVSGTYGEDRVEYTLSRESGEEVGTYVITASGNAVQGNYNVSYENGTFTISANSITPSVSLSQVIYTYDGTEKKPAVTVKAGETVLAETDYTVTYANNINAGTANVTVSEAEGGSYSFDAVTVHFTIEKAAITPSVSISSWVYGEEASKPVVNGNAGNGAVTFSYKVKGSDDSSYSTEAPINMGSYTVKADIAETENYLAGSATADFEITMAEQGSSELKFIFEEGEPKPEYTGSAITPKVIGYCGNELLTEGVDYSVKYSKNINAGTAEAKVSGKGDYAGEETLSFTIAPKKLSDESGEPAEGIVVTGLVVQGTGTVKPRLIYNGAVAASKEYEYKGSRTASGNEAVTITAKNVNFTGSIENLEVTRITDKNEFKKAEIKVKLNKVSRTYDGTPQLLSDELIVTNKEGTALVEDTDYIVSYPSDVINAGTVKVNIVGIGTHTGSVSKSYRIAPAKDAAISVSLVQEEGMAADTYSFVKTGVTPEVTASAKVNGHTDILEEGKDYTVSYSSNKKAGAAAKVKLTMLGNYKGAKAVTKSFDIEKASLEDAEVFLSDLIYKKAGTYKSKYVISVDGETLASTEYKVTYSDNGKVTLADNENEKTVTVTITSKEKNFKAGSIIRTYKVYRNASATDVSKASVKLVVKGGTKSQSSVGFTGAPITFDPADDNRQADISVKIGKTTLYGAQVFEYFDVSYADNVLKGKGTIILTAKDTESNPYSGMCSGKFTITAHKIK